MDADRRRKTVIAGTFAIGRKSVSNSRPISAGEMQRPKAEMTVTSTRCQRFTKPAPKGSTSAEGAGWGLSFEKTLTGDDGGQNRSIGIDLLFPSRDLLLQSFRPQFLFSARNILSPENV
jgi:hypothetical protein